MKGDGHASTLTPSGGYASGFAAPLIGAAPCQDITAVHAQKIVNVGPTAGEGARVHWMLSALVGAGVKGGYLVNPVLAEVYWQAGDGLLPAPKVTVAGSPLLVDPAEIPCSDDVAVPGKAICPCGERDELVAILAAYSGLRWGELAALTTGQVAQPAIASCVRGTARLVSCLVIDHRPPHGLSGRAHPASKG